MNYIFGGIKHKINCEQKYEILKKGSMDLTVNKPSTQPQLLALKKVTSGIGQAKKNR